MNYQVDLEGHFKDLVNSLIVERCSLEQVNNLTPGGNPEVNKRMEEILNTLHGMYNHFKDSDYKLAYYIAKHFIGTYYAVLFK